jgi:hypothetical protein
MSLSHFEEVWRGGPARSRAERWRHEQRIDIEPGLDLLSSGLYVAERDQIYHHGGGDPWGYYWGFPAERVMRDANGRDGMWHAIVSLPHEAVEFRFGEGRWLEVPMFEVVDIERAAWRRRPWWGSRSGASMPMWRL